MATDEPIPSLQYLFPVARKETAKKLNEFEPLIH
jgi:hypothetical protein